MQGAPTFDPALPHWEWRTFDADFDRVRASLAALDAGQAHESDETYVLSAVTDAGVKIRAGLLEVKKLEAVDAAGLEQWRLTARWSFPLPRDAADEVCTVLGLAPLPPGAGAFSQDELLAALTAADRTVRAVGVRKTRRRYAVNGCLAEITQVIAAGTTAFTFAVEAVDAACLAATVAMLGLSGRVNTSYPSWLNAVVSGDSSGGAGAPAPPEAG